MRRRSSLLRELFEEDAVSKLPGLMDITYPEEPRALPSVAKSRTRRVSGLRTVPQDEKAKAVGMKESPKLFRAIRNMPTKFATRMAQTGIMSK